MTSVGPSLKYPDKPTNCDDNKLEVPVEMYTRSFGLSVSNGITVTTTTRTITETAYETGCPLPQYTTTAACGRGGGSAKRQAAFQDISPPVPTSSTLAAATHVPALVARDDWSDDMTDGCDMTMDVAFYLEDGAAESDIDQVMARLGNTDLRHHRYAHPALGTILIFVSQIPESLMEKISLMPGVSYIPWALIIEFLLSSVARAIPQITSSLT
jgi:hypothetical protein